MIGVGTAGPVGEAAAESDRRAGRDRSGDERSAWISLAAIPGIGPVGFASLLLRFGSASASITAPVEAVVHELPRADAETEVALQRSRDGAWVSDAAKLEQAAASVGAVVVTALDSGYPPALARLTGRPPVLYVVGSLDALGDPAVAVVGTRRPSGYGLSAAAEIADELARAGITVISGLALGIDGRAHVAAIDAGGRTVAVLPSPVDRIYPPRHRGLAARIVAEGGALASESPPGRASGKPDFARRNRIISGLARAVIVVEAPDHSGALLTSAAALAQGRDVYAVPGPIDSVASRGCNRLIADHQAELVTSAVSLVHRLGLRATPHQAQLVASLSETEGVVLATLIGRSGSIEELSARSHLATPPLVSALTLLEARGLVASYGGVTFHATLAARRIGDSGQR